MEAASGKSYTSHIEAAFPIIRATLNNWDPASLLTLPYWKPKPDPDIIDLDALRSAEEAQQLTVLWEALRRPRQLPPPSQDGAAVDEPEGGPAEWASILKLVQGLRSWTAADAEKGHTLAPRAVVQWINTSGTANPGS